MIYPNWPNKNNLFSMMMCRDDQLESYKTFPENAVWLNQIHGDEVCNIDTTDTIQYSHFASTYELYKKNNVSEAIKSKLVAADASFTTKKNIACVVRTADCLPILVVNNDANWIAAIHAGWRGLLSGVIEKTLLNYKSSLADLNIWLGPAICQKHFTIGAEVRDEFLASNPAYHSAFKPSLVEHNKWQGDLNHIASAKLIDLGVTNIYHSEQCTYCNSQLYDSYRRDNVNSGRLISLIWLI